MAKNRIKKAKAPTLEDLILLRDEIAAYAEAIPVRDDDDQVAQAMVRLGIRLGYIIIGSIVSIAESQRTIAAEAEMAMQQGGEPEKPDPFETLA